MFLFLQKSLPYMQTCVTPFYNQHGNVTCRMCITSTQHNNSILVHKLCKHIQG